MLMLAAIALILPAAFRVASGTTVEGLGKLSVLISAVLLLMYLLYLVFALMTHASLFAGSHSAATLCHSLLRDTPPSVRRRTAVISN
jgi:Ca2+:H+ antiporter